MPTIAGLVMGLCFAGMALLVDLPRHLVPFLVLYGLAYLTYAVAVWRLLRRPDGRRRLILIVALGVLFRALLLLASPPTLSTDVYRYIWDGRLANAGINPYAHAVDSPLLDPFEASQRALVDHSWMATPYLPTAQAFFAVVYRLAPDSPLAFQVAAALLDLLAGVLVIDLLRRLGLSRVRSLIYLWNPLVIVEFAHGAHVDALMIFLMVAALWALVVVRSRILSVIALTAATLTKGLPLLLLPVVVRRWRWHRAVLYAGLVIAVCVPFALGAGWGLAGPLDGEGLFGALRIYADQWNYNSGVYHWLEVLLSGYRTPGAVPLEAVGRAPIIAAKSIVTISLGLVLVFVWSKGREGQDDLSLLRLALIPLAAYLLLATTVHPWYVTLIIPLLPFLPSRPGSSSKTGRFLVPGLLFPAAVALSYLTYLDPDNLREYTLIRLLEYIPLYAALVWAAWPASGRAGETGTG
jgi:hypothetical protein